VTILLDIDGVMVPATGWKAPELGKDGFPNFSKKAIHSLNKILFITNASLLLTTSHKSKYSLDAWKQIFADRGINAVISTLNNSGKITSRKEEVLDWLQKNQNEKNFVIIDDDKSLYDLPIEYKNSVVLTSPLVGLNEETANKAIEVLRSHD
jgi:hypothetical protein